MLASANDFRSKEEATAAEHGGVGNPDHGEYAGDDLQMSSLYDEDGHPVAFPVKTAALR